MDTGNLHRLLLLPRCFPFTRQGAFFFSRCERRRMIAATCYFRQDHAAASRSCKFPTSAGLFCARRHCNYRFRLRETPFQRKFLLEFCRFSAARRNAIIPGISQQLTTIAINFHFQPGPIIRDSVMNIEQPRIIGSENVRQSDALNQKLLSGCNLSPHSAKFHRFPIFD